MAPPAQRDLAEILLGMRPRALPTLSQADLRLNVRAVLVTQHHRQPTRMVQRGVLGGVPSERRYSTRERMC